VVGIRQLETLGAGRGAIAHRLSIGRLHQIYRGVYAVGHTCLNREANWMAAVLACGTGSLLSHRSAAALWGVRQTARSSIDVLAPGKWRKGAAGIEVHTTRRIHPDDRARVGNIPVTSLARTLVDLTPLLTRPQLARAVEEAERLQLLDVRQVVAACDRRPGISKRPLLALLHEATEPQFTRSELERRFLDLCANADIPTPSLNAWIEGYEVDALWRDDRLIVELDGHEFHRTRQAFERDRARDAALQVAGFRVLRITHRRLVSEPKAVIADLRALLC
jgi:hypothetical protein